MCHAGAVTTQLHRGDAGLLIMAEARLATRVTARSASRYGHTLLSISLSKGHQGATATDYVMWAGFALRGSGSCDVTKT